MTELQIILLLATLFFIYKAYMRFMGMGDDIRIPSQENEPAAPEASGNLDLDEAVQKADTAYEAGDFLAALNLLEKAREMAPENTEVLSRLGFVLAKNDEDFKAMEIYKDALALDPEDDTIHSALASLYRKKGMTKEAETHYQEAIRIDPDYAVTYFNYGNLLLDLERKDEAKSMYEKALALDPDFAEARAALDEL